MGRAPPLRLSYGSMSAYIACPRRYAAVYLEGATRVRTAYEHRGIAVHAAISEYLKGEISTEEDVLRSLRRHFSTDAGNVDWQKESPVSLLNDAEKGLSLYLEKVLPNLRPMEGGVEVEFERRLGKVLLTGRIDAVSENYTIVDHKTSRRSSSPYELALSLQPTVYALGLGMEDGARAVFGCITFLKKGPKVDMYITERTKEDVGWLRDLLIPQVADGISKGRFPPRPAYHCMSCHVRLEFCGFRRSWGAEVKEGEESAE